MSPTNDDATRRAVGVLSVVVYGRPAPQGSKRYVGKSKKTGRAVLVESSRHVKPWRALVEEAARLVAGDEPIDGPLSVRMVFTMPRPKRTRNGWAHPAVMPDLSKLARSTEDALTTAGLWADDARVVEYERLAKVYPGADPEALARPGVVITVVPLEAA